MTNPREGGRDAAMALGKNIRSRLRPSLRRDRGHTQPTSEGRPHKWLAVEKSLTDFVADGFELKTMVYDSSETAAKSEPDVHYFLQKGTTLVRCDFKKRDQASIYWCYQLTAPNRP
jgi:hypothetical protein